MRKELHDVNDKLSPNKTSGPVLMVPNGPSILVRCLVEHNSSLQLTTVFRTMFFQIFLKSICNPDYKTGDLHESVTFSMTSTLKGQSLEQNRTVMSISLDLAKAINSISHKNCSENMSNFYGSEKTVIYMFRYN